MIALGAFILPKQTFFAQTIDACCKSVSGKDCCDKNNTESQKPCKDNEDQNSCNDCSTCSSCHHIVTSSFASMSEVVWNLDYKKTNQSKKFTYLSPEISSLFSKIWQPPKIG